MAEKNNNPINKDGLNFIQLTAVAIGTTVGSGVFGIAGDMARNGAGTLAVLIGWLVCGIGMFALTMCFFRLNSIRPELTGGIYTYAREGFGEYVGFNSAWGYWISAFLTNVSYSTFMFASIGYFIPAFQGENNILTIVCSSIFIWLIAALILKGVKEATIINLVITISKFIPIFIFILAILFLRKFNFDVFKSDFLGENTGLSIIQQIRATSGTTVWAFIGIEGAVVISGRAKRSSDVGKATITAFLGVLSLYIVVAILSMGIMPRRELAELGNPSMAQVLESVVGKWGAIVVNLGVIISILGASLGYTIIATECPFEAAKEGALPRAFTKQNKNGAPVFSIILTVSIVQFFLIVSYFSTSTYQLFYSISASMILIPYLLSAMYYLKISLDKKSINDTDKKKFRLSKTIGVIGTIYGLWLIYASGIIGLISTALFYVLGILVYIRAMKENNKPYFNNTRDIVILICLLLLAVFAIYLFFAGRIALI